VGSDFAEPLDEEVAQEGVVFEGAVFVEDGELDE
jgi:hypothetical protein